MAGLALSAVVTAIGSWADPQRGIPFLSSFDLPPTRHNGEVWTFAAAEAGQIWIGSDELFLFNGESRQKIALPFEAYAVRALTQDASGKLWVGAIGEIGYLDRTETGGWHYVSKREELRQAGVSELRVWDALATDEGITFVTDSGVLRWSNGHLEQWSLPSASRLHSMHDRNSLWIFEPGVGLLRMEKNGPQLMVPLADLPGPAVGWIIELDSADTSSPAQHLLIGSADGVYRRNKTGWTKLERFSAAISGKSAWRALMLDAETIAVGTIQGGVVIGTTGDRILATIDRSSGLPNESVTSLWLDQRSQLLWIGYIGGMSCVDARGIASVFDARNGFADAPALKATLHAQVAHVVTRHTLSQIAPQPDGRPARAKTLARIATPVSGALSNGANLWLSSSGGGLWRLAGGAAKLEVPVAGFIFALAEAREPATELFYFEGTKLFALVPRAAGGWESRSLNLDIGATPMSACRDRHGDLWVSTVTNGVVRLAVETRADGLHVFPRRQYRPGQGLPSAEITRPAVATLGERIFVLSEQGILGYSQARDSFEPVPALERFVALAAPVSSDSGTTYWLVRLADLDPSLAKATALIRVRADREDGELTWEPINIAGLDRLGRITHVSVSGSESPTLWIAGSQSLLRLESYDLSAASPPPALQLRAVLGNNLPLERPAPGTKMPLDSAIKRLRFELDGVKRADGQTVFVQASLRGVSNEWTKPQADPTFEFAGLPSGEYSFRARAIDAWGRTGPEFTLSFFIAPPWFGSTSAIVAYVLAGVLVIVAGVRLRLRHLHQQNVRLNQLIDERTAELARANAARNEFLEAISHEIRNPLNGVTNLVDLLHDAKLDPDARKLAESLGRSAAHLKQVFGDVLGYTKLEYGRVEMESVTFSLRRLLEDVVGLFGVQAKEQKTYLRLSIGAEFDDGFHGDAGKIQTVISNYVSNALKYAPGGTVEVIACNAATTTSSGPRRIWIGVRDNGPGLSPQEQQQLFHKFARGQNAKSRGIAGTGLGLAISRTVAELLDGKVGVTSAEGRGATFWLEVPLAPAPLPEQEKISKTSSSASPPAARGTALIVDDQEYNRVVLRGIAQRLGYRAEVASCDAEVWPAVARERFDLVFLDWELPGLSGGEIAQRLRHSPHAQGAVIIATTAHDNEEILQRCLDAGMDGFAAKPFDTAQIRMIVAASVQRRRGAGNDVLLLPVERTRASSPSTGLSLSAFDDFAAGDPARAQQAVSLYVKTLDDELSALREEIQRGDGDAIARRAHRLRSHAGLVNGTALNLAAQQLMLAAKNGAAGEWRNDTEEVFAHATRLKSEILSLVGGRASTT